MINTSLKTSFEIELPKPTWFPKEFAWENYKYIFLLPLWKLYHFDFFMSSFFDLSGV